MQTVTVNKQWLIDTLKINLASHRGKYEKALEGYRKEAIKQLTGWVDRLKSGESVIIYSHLPVPEDHSDDYRTIIAMLSNDTRNEVEIDRKDYTCFVEDKWTWSDRFETTSASYDVGD